MLCNYTNGGGRDAPYRLFHADATFVDGTRYEMVATAVPQSDDYPEGIKYRFQYMDDNGETILRFDNVPEHPDAPRHHVHTPSGTVEPIDFEGLSAHIRAFEEAVDAYREGLP